MGRRTAPSGRPARRRGLVAVAVAAALMAGGCSKKTRDVGQPPGQTAPPTTPTAVQFTVSGIDANATAAPDEATIAAVKATLERWVADAVVAPLHSGQPAGDLSASFTAPALARLADPAVRASLVDEGLPAASSSVTASNASAALFSVAGPDGTVALIGANVDLRLKAVGPSLDVNISHLGELVLAPEPDGWKIESFLMYTTRDS